MGQNCRSVVTCCQTDSSKSDAIRISGNIEAEKMQGLEDLGINEVFLEVYQKKRVGSKDIKDDSDAEFRAYGFPLIFVSVSSFFDQLNQMSEDI